MVVQHPCRWWWWMRAGENWEVSRYAHYAPAVVEPKGSACPLHVAMPSIVTFPIDLLASALSPLKHAIAFNAIFSSFSCNFPKVNHSFSPSNHDTNSGIILGCRICNIFCYFFIHNGSCINAISLGMCIILPFLCVLWY